MRRLLIVIVWVLVSIVPAAAYPQAKSGDGDQGGVATVTPELLKRVKTMLSGYEYVPEPAEWKKLGDAAADALIAIFNDTSNPPYMRSRAVSSLAHFKLPRVKELLVSILRNEGETVTIRRKAVLALSYGFGEEVLGTIKPFLADKHVHLRDAAVRAVGQIKSPQALKLLRETLKTEREAFIKETISEMIAKLRLVVEPRLKNAPTGGE